MFFTESHEWVIVEGEIGKVGITDYAQRELGEIVHIELPKVGQVVQAGQEVCVLESTKAAADIYAPVSGTIIAVNEALQTTPSLLNREAEKGGWLFQIKLAPSPRREEQLKRLLTRSGYQSLFKL